MNDFEPIDIEFIINSKKVKQDANEVKKSLAGIVEEARDSIDDVAEQVGNLSVAVDNLSKSRTKEKRTLRSSVRSMVSWNAAISFGFDLLKQYTPQIIDYFRGILGLNEAMTEAALKQQTLNKALESNSYKASIEKLLELKNVLKLAKEGTVDKTVAVDKYNKIIGNTAGKAQDLASVEQGLIDNESAYVEMTFKKAAANLALAEASNKALEAEKRRTNFEAEDFTLSDAFRIGSNASSDPQARLFSTLFGSEVDIDAAKERAEKAAGLLEKEGESLQKIYERLIGEAEKAAKKLNTTVFGNGNRQASKILKARKSLLDKIAALDTEYARKQLDRDEEEQQALKDKFAKIRKLVQEFNADPKNAKVKIDLDGLEGIEARATTDLTFKQNTRSLKEQLEEQKKLYQEFEDFKEKFGTVKAKDQYKDQLAQFDSYVAVLKQKIKDNEEAFTAVSNGTATGGQAERVRLLNKEIAEAKQKQAQQYQELLASLQSYEQERKRLITDYQAQRAQLIENGNTEEAEKLKEKFNQDLSDLDEAYAKGTDEYKALIRGVENLSETAARAVIANARKMVNALVLAGKLSEETAAEINKKINDLENTVNSDGEKKAQGIVNGIREISGALLNLSDSLAIYDRGLADTIGTIGELGNVASDGLDAVSKFSSGDIVGGIAAGLNAIAGLFSIGARARESRRQAEAELLRLQQLAADGELRLNEIQRERNLAKAEEVELTLKSINAQREALAIAQQQVALDEQRVFAQLQQEQFITNSRTEKYGGFLGIGRKTRVVNDYASLLGLTFEEIEALFEKGKLTDRANELFEQLRRLKEEGNDIDALLGNLQQQASEVFTGTTASSISDSIIAGLKEGYDSFEDFAGNVENLLQGAILNAIKFNTLEEPLQQLYEQFAQFAESEGGLSQAEADAIRAQYQNTVQRALDQYEQLSGILDEDLLTGDQNTRGLQGAIRRELTEATGSELTGLFRGQFDVTKRHFELHEKHFEIEKQHLDGTLQILAKQSLIEENTRNTVIELKNSVTELKAIKENTKPGQSGRDLGKTG